MKENNKILRECYEHHFIKKLGELLNFYFSDDDTKFIRITSDSGTWTSSRPKYRLPFSKTFLNFAINYLLDNCYFELGSLCFRQLIEVTMVFDPALLMTTYFFIFIKRSSFFKQKNGSEKNSYIFKYSCMTYAISIIMNLKKVTIHHCNIIVISSSVILS